MRKGGTDNKMKRSKFLIMCLVFFITWKETMNQEVPLKKYLNKSNSRNSEGDHKDFRTRTSLTKMTNISEKNNVPEESLNLKSLNAGNKILPRRTVTPNNIGKIHPPVAKRKNVAVSRKPYIFYVNSPDSVNNIKEQKNEKLPTETTEKQQIKENKATVNKLVDKQDLEKEIYKKNIQHTVNTKPDTTVIKSKSNTEPEKKTFIIRKTKNDKTEINKTTVSVATEPENALEIQHDPNKCEDKSEINETPCFSDDESAVQESDSIEFERSFVPIQNITDTVIGPINSTTNGNESLNNTTITENLDPCDEEEQEEEEIEEDDENESLVIKDNNYEEILEISPRPQGPVSGKYEGYHVPNDYYQEIPKSENNFVNENLYGNYKHNEPRIEQIDGTSVISYDNYFQTPTPYNFKQPYYYPYFNENSKRCTGYHPLSVPRQGRYNICYTGQAYNHLTNDDKSRIWRSWKNTEYYIKSKNILRPIHNESYYSVANFDKIKNQRRMLYQKKLV